MFFCLNRNGDCVDPMSEKLVALGNPAVMYSKRQGNVYGAKVVYTDYVSKAVVYGCGQVRGYIKISSSSTDQHFACFETVLYQL